MTLLHCCCLLLPQASLRIRTSLALQQCFAIILLTNSKKLQERHDAVERQAPLLIMLIHRLRHKLLLKMCTHKVRKQKWITVFHSSFLSQKKKKYGAKPTDIHRICILFTTKLKKKATLSSCSEKFPQLTANDF